jgi:hypothetical protein
MFADDVDLFPQVRVDLRYISPNLVNVQIMLPNLHKPYSVHWSVNCGMTSLCFETYPWLSHSLIQILLVYFEPVQLSQYSDQAVNWTAKELCTNPGKGMRYFSSSQHPYWLWGQHSLLFSVYYWVLIPLEWSGQLMRLTPQLHLLHSPCAFEVCVGTPRADESWLLRKFTSHLTIQAVWLYILLLLIRDSDIVT